MRKWVLLALIVVSLSGCGVGLCVNPETCPSVSKQISLTAVEFDAQSITLRWTAEPNTTPGVTYKVYRSASPNIETLDDITSNGTLVAEVIDATTTVLTGIDTSTPHYFNVVVSRETSVLGFYSQRGPFCGGSGTPTDKYLICDAGSLQNVSLNLSASYSVVSDIDISDSANWNSGKGFRPIGSSSAVFSGKIDGQGFAITGLHINRPSDTYVGLIAYGANGTTVENLELSQVSIQGFSATTPQSYTAALAAYLEIETDGVSTFENLTVSGSVSSQGSAGGIVGFTAQEFLRITNSRFEGTVAGYDSVGGIGGELTGLSSCNNCTFENNFASGTVTGRDYVGGLVGFAYMLSLTGSRFEGTVMGSRQYAGGLVGMSPGSQDQITHSSFQGTVTGDYDVGGLVGYTDGRIFASYAKGTATGTHLVGGIAGSVARETNETYALVVINSSSNAGGLLGTTWGTLSGNYWDPVTSGRSRGIGDNATEEVAGQYEKKSAAQLQVPATFTNWDFENDWEISKPGESPSIREPQDCKTGLAVTVTDTHTDLNGTYLFDPTTRLLTVSTTRVTPTAITQIETMAIDVSGPLNPVPQDWTTSYVPVIGSFFLRWTGPPVNGATVQVSFPIPDNHRRRYEVVSRTHGGSPRVRYDVRTVCE